MWFWHSAALCFLLGVSVAQGAATTPDPGCGTVPADIVFLLDASGSVGRGNFDKQKQFVSRFAQTFDIGPNNVQIGVVTFSTDVHNQFNLNQHNSKNDLIHAIDGMPYQSGGTNTAKALNYVVTNSFTHAAGDRDHVANILIVMTDGQSADKTSTIAAANKVHGANIKTFGIGIGTGVNQDELNHIATDSKHVFTVSNFDALQTLQAELKKTACEIDGGWSKWGTYSPCSKSCGGGTHYHQRDCNNPPPANGGKNCVGNNRETAACNTGACPTTPPPTTTTTARTTPLPTTVQPGCGVVPADIVFILDSSGSVGSSNFQKMLDFVKSMVQGLDIGPNGTEISVVTFSDNHHLQFHLNRYHDKTSIVNAISNVHYSMGGTNTADALKYAREVSFTSANGKRPNAAQIAIVITDGKSNSPPATASEASRLRNDGVTVFSIGVGSGPNTDELKAMATDPDNDHVFVVNNFDALSHIKGELQQKACEVKVTTAPQTVNCGAKADIVFLLDSSGSVGSSNFRKMLDFVKNVSSTFTLGPNDVQVGVDTFSSSHRAEFNLSRFTDISALQHAVDAIHYDAGGTNTGAALAFMHSQSFSTAAGQRPNVPKIAIVVTDGNSMNSQLTATEADKARKDGIKIIAIGVGHGINDAELNAIGSDPDSQYVFRAENFDVLSSLKAQLSSKTCEASTPLTNATDCHAGAKADIIFNLDSSGSVGSANFDKMLEFVKSMVKNFQVGPNAIQVGLNIFSSRPYIQFQLNQHGDKNALMNAIDHVPYKSGGTNTGSALKEVYSKMFTASNGDRPDAPNIEIVITDGLSNNHPDTVKEASNSKQSGITLFSVGVGSGVSKAELNDIASDPDSTHVMTVGDFSQLQSIQGAFAAQTCAVIPPSPPSFVPTAPVHLTDPCQDNINNCAQYGGQACSGRYLDWAKVNCQRTCGFCPTALPTVPPECKDALADCKSYDPAVCKSYGDWAVANCRQFCGYCSVNAVGANGFYGKCSYNGKTYSQGQTWSDGCAYECSCDDASKGQYSCYSKCPSYYNLPPQCILAQKTGDCCLQPVCDFSPSYHTTNGQTVGKVNGMNTCLYKSHNYFQGQTWQDGCEFDCQCVDAGAGMYTCQSRCPVYKGLPPECTLQRVAGKCCAEPKCTFNQQYGTFTGNGVISGPGVGATPTAPTQCVDKVPNCNLYNANMCTDNSYREWAVKNCPKFCNFCSMLNQPGPTDRCVYKGIAYAQGQTWLDNCDYECLCENAKYGYYRCNKRCPDYVNLPLGCHMAQSNTSCCKTVQCDAGNANFLGSATVPGVIGSQPIPNIVPTSAPQPGTPGATNAPSPGLVPKLAGCYVQGTLYQQGLRWTSGCDWACICEDGSTGRYRCEPKCPTFGQLPPSCTLVEDARDLCCKVPQCPASVNGTTIQIPIPTYGQGYSGYGTATMPASITGTGTGPVPTGTVGGSTFVNQQGSVTVSGSRNGCVYKGHTYQQGQAWDDGCDLKCTCIDGTLGTYRCLDRCPLYQNLPPQCHLLQDPNDHCCKTYSCDYSQANTTPPPAFARTTPATGGEYCVYKNQYYLQGEEWNDGCSYTCRCEDAAKGYFQCTDRCPKFDNIPLGCSWVSDQKDGCCRIPSCPSSSSGAAPSGYIGTFNGYGRPATLISNPNIAASAYGRACLYKGSIYQQGQTWVDGCDYTCECTDASTGKYRCNDRCPRYTSLPSNCHFVTDPNNRCCSQPDCSPVVGGACSDKRSDCAGYGQYACVAPYESWARDNCAKYCGYCGGNGPVTTPATVVCADKIPNCAAYTKTACSTNVNWARYNCINFCGLCGGTGGTGTGVITGGTGTGGTGTGVITGGTGTGTGGTGTGVNTGGTGTSGTGTGVITGGTGGTITGSGTCVDKIPNCVEFTRDACGDQFKNWALQNCPLFCNLCAQLSGTGSATGTATGTGGGFTGTGTINTGGNTGGVITGTSSVCYYKGQVYHTGETWQDGCSFNCTCTDGNTGTYRCLQLCTQYTNLPSGCILQKGQGECCAKPVCNGGTSGSGSTIINGNSQSGTMTGTTQGCTYKGHVYHQGEVFDDGCTFKCTCIDASRGQYNCVQKCVTWNLPSSCHLNAPAAGKCCKTPNCPPDVIINYPPNYVEE